MKTIAWFFRLLSMVLWVGSLCFFAFVVAPVAFGQLGDQHKAGLVVGQSLRILHWIGLASGGVFLLSTLVTRETRDRNRLGEIAVPAGAILTLIMLAITAYSQFIILPRMERDRLAVGGDINHAEVTDAHRLDFERLHPLSEKLEGAVLFCGLGVVFFLGREASSASARAARSW